MSRIGKLPIAVVAGVQVQVDGPNVAVVGPKGKLAQVLPRGISAEVAGGALVLRRSDESKSQRALHGLSRALLANAVHGVSAGFSKQLEIHGVGYRAEVAGGVVKLTLGYTHAIEYAVPPGIQISVEKNTRIAVSGCDRQRVGQVAAELRGLRPPDVYKQKGVRYVDERLRKKAGKTATK